MRTLLSRFFFLFLAFSFYALNSVAQQGKGLFFSTFGTGAPIQYGDFDNYQAFYFEIPPDENRPVYLRVFDPDLGGIFDEKHDNFDTKTRFVVLGNESAATVYGAKTVNEYNTLRFDREHILYDETFGVDTRSDGRWVNLLQLKKEDGYLLDNGNYRYALIVFGLKGDDGNFYDLALSYSTTEKEPPSTTSTYVYDLSFRIPSLSIYKWDEFRGQIKLRTDQRDIIRIATFDMDDIPISLTLPFGEVLPLKPSGDGDWVFNRVSIPNGQSITEVGFDFFGRPFNNTFNMVVLDAEGKPLPIYLPILDYEPPVIPELTYDTRFVNDDCKTVSFEVSTNDDETFSNIEAQWIIQNDTLSGSAVSVTFDSLGYQPFRLLAKAESAGGVKSFEFVDSILVNRPPVAKTAEMRHGIPRRMMAFDGTRSDDPDGKVESYFWDFGDGSTATGARVDHEYRSPGTYVVTLRVRDDSNSPCSESTIQSTVKINEPPVPKITGPGLVQVGQLFELSGEDSYDPDGEIISFAWQLGEDTLLYGPKINYAIRKEEALPVILQVTDDSQTFNSVQRARYVVPINERPLAIAGNDKVISPNRPATYNGTRSYDPNGSIKKYEWVFDDGQVLEGAIVKHAFATPGKHIAVLRVTDNTEKSIGVDTVNVLVNSPPMPIITGDDIFQDGLVTLSADESHDPDGEIIDMYWTINKTVIQGANFTYSFREPGTYSVELTVIDNSGTYSSVQTSRKEFTINRPPVAQFTAPSLVAANSPITFDASDSYDPDGSVETFRWDFGDGDSLKTGKTLTHVFGTPGIYQVQLEVEDNLGGSKATSYAHREVIVNHAPILEYDPILFVVQYDTVMVDISSSYDPDGTITAYEWFEDGEWVPGNETREVVAEKDSQRVYFRIVDNTSVSNNVSEGSLMFKLNSAPVAIANGPVVTHQPLVLFDGTQSYDPDGDGLKYRWDFGDGKSTQGAIALHRYEFGGSFKAVLSVNDGRGMMNSYAYDTVDVFINRPPEVYFELPLMVCVGDPVRYDASKSYDPDDDLIRYEWDFGDGNSAISTTGTHTFTQEGRYQVVLNADDTRGMPNSFAQYVQLIDVVGPPEASAGEDMTVCANQFVRFDGMSTIPAQDYLWDFGDGNTGTGSSPIHQYTEPGTYRVKLEVITEKTGSCPTRASDEITVTVLPEPIAEFSLPSVAGVEDALVFDPSPSIQEGHSISYIRWDIGGIERIEWQKVIRRDSTGAIRSVKWQLRKDGDETILQEVNDRSSNGRLPVYTRSLDLGKYPISLYIETSSASGCNEAQLTSYLTIKKKPELTVSDIPILVPNVPFTFSGAEVSGDLNDIETAYWDFGDGNRGEGLFSTHSYAEPGTYTVTFVADNGTGQASSVSRVKKTVRVNAPPQIKFTGSTRAVPGATLEFSAKESVDPDGEIIEYQWFFSDGFRASGPTVTHTFPREGNYNVTLTATDNSEAANSVSSVNKTIRIAEAPELTLKIPTIVCPGVKINLIEALSIQPDDASLIEIMVGSKEMSVKEARNLGFDFPGVYNLQIRLKDGIQPGEDAVIRQSLIVNGPPELYVEVPETIKLGIANDFATFSAGKSFDPNGDPVRISWDFGDGRTTIGKTVQHRYARPGTYTVRVVASDNHNLSCSSVEKTFTVTVTN